MAVKLDNTLHHGAVVSKPVAAQWAAATVAQQWATLIAQAGETRHTGEWAAQTDPIPGTLTFLRYTLAQSQSFKQFSQEETHV